MVRKKTTRRRFLLILGVAIVIFILLFSGFVVFPTLLSLSDSEPYEGWKLEGEIFDRESYEGLADIVLSGTIDYIEPSWTIDPDMPGSTPHPKDWWFNVWYKEEGSTEWEIIAGVSDETNRGRDIPDDIIPGYDDLFFMKHPALIQIVPFPEPHPSFYLEWMKTTLITELNGELRVDARVQMIRPGITFYDEHTMGSDYASISPAEADIDDADDEVSAPGFELIVFLGAILLFFHIFRKKKR